MKRKVFTLLILVGLTLCALWSGRNSTSAVAKTPIPTVLACTDSAMDNCNNKAVQVKNDCEFRNQGGTTEYTSCRCQSIRSAEACYRGAGCQVGANLFRETSPECFGPSSGGSGGCGVTFDGGYSNPCDCNPDDPSCTSPLIFDLGNNGYHLTSVGTGVRFDLRLTGPVQTAWTQADSDDAWLVLDRDGNGTIDNGAELFGNFTPQLERPDKNGFLALGEYDKQQNGGNGDGLITSADHVFADLRLWQDKDHNGRSEASELISLITADVWSINLDYKESRQMDPFGNLFRYRSKVNERRFAYDVFLTHEQQ